MLRYSLSGRRRTPEVVCAQWVVLEMRFASDLQILSLFSAPNAAFEQPAQVCKCRPRDNVGFLALGHQGFSQAGIAALCRSAMLFSRRLESRGAGNPIDTLCLSFDVNTVEVSEQKKCRLQGSTNDGHAMLRVGLHWKVSLSRCKVCLVNRMDISMLLTINSR